MKCCLSGSRFCRRNQYPLKNYVAATCHKIMGDTLTEACTKISDTEKIYRLWQSEQVYVIVSRVRSLKDLTFVGSMTDTMNAIKSVLTTQKENDYLMTMFYKEMSILNPNRLPTIDYSKGVFEPYYVQIPKTPNGFVFYIQSTRCTKAKKIGFCIDLREELLSCNNLSRETIQFQPYALMVFIAGFSQPSDGELAATRLNSTISDDDSIADTIRSFENINSILLQQSTAPLVLIKCCKYEKIIGSVLFLYFSLVRFLLSKIEHKIEVIIKFFIINCLHKFVLKHVHFLVHLISLAIFIWNTSFKINSTLIPIEQHVVLCLVFLIISYFFMLEDIFDTVTSTHSGSKSMKKALGPFVSNN